MTYTEFVETNLKDFCVSEPIYTGYIAEKLAKEYEMPQKEAAAATAVAFKRIMDGKELPELRFYQKGTYYFTSETPFGEVGIDKNRIIEDKYLVGNNGYETGYSVLYQLGLTTQLPKERCVASNNSYDSARTDKKLGVTVRPPKTRVNKENKKYLQFLDALEIMDKAPIEADDPYMLLADYVEKKGLEYKYLLLLADRYYGKKTVLKIAHIASKGDI